MNQMVIDGVMYHPTFLYESVWNFLIFFGLLFFRRINPKRGMVFLMYAVTYSIGRFYIEGLRTDSLYVIGELRTAQVVSILTIVAGVIMMLYLIKTSNDRYLDVPMKRNRQSRRIKIKVKRRRKRSNGIV